MPNNPTHSPALHPLVVALDDLYDEFNSDCPAEGISNLISAVQIKISTRLFALESAQQVFAALGTE